MRFNTQQMLEGYINDSKGEQRYPVRLQSPAYPLTISCRLNDFTGETITIEEVDNNNIAVKHTLTEDQSITVKRGDAICITIPASKPIPSVFSLYQNNPNPFNPSTTISFDLPVQSKVNLTVYDIVGKEVMVLADAEYEAGSHTVTGRQVGECDLRLAA